MQYSLDGFDDHPMTAEGFERAFEDGREVLPYCAVLNEGDRQAAARELVGLLCDPSGEADGDPPEPPAALERLLERVEPEYEVVERPPIAGVGM